MVSKIVQSVDAHVLHIVSLMMHRLDYLWCANSNATSLYTDHHGLCNLVLIGMIMIGCRCMAPWGKPIGAHQGMKMMRLYRWGTITSEGWCENEVQIMTYRDGRNGVDGYPSRMRRMVVVDAAVPLPCRMVQVGSCHDRLQTAATDAWDRSWWFRLDQS